MNSTLNPILLNSTRFLPPIRQMSPLAPAVMEVATTPSMSIPTPKMISLIPSQVRPQIELTVLIIDCEVLPNET